MKKLISFGGKLWHGEEGATMVEYGIMVALIAAVAIGTIALLGGKVHQAFVDTNAAMP